MSTLAVLSEHACWGGVQGFYRHDSAAIGLPMQFGVYRPPQANGGAVPALFYLAGLTCNEETFAIKAGAQRFAAEHGLIIVTPTRVRVTPESKQRTRRGISVPQPASTSMPSCPHGTVTGGWKPI